MFHRLLSSIAAATAVACGSAAAATVEVSVVDQKGGPAANAVVTLVPDAVEVASHVRGRSVIDQQHETFLPLVVVVRKGGEVVFTNHDTTMHQVYSFSAIKQFQFELDRSQVSKPVVFDTAGTAAIGCNIHDGMVAYVFVADAPFAATTDANGHAEFREVPEGAWHASAWHPRLKPGKPAQPVAVAVGGDTRFAITVPLSGASMPAMSHMHKSDY
jgi:plastocyanin